MGKKNMSKNTENKREGGADVFLDSLDSQFKRTPVLHRTQIP